MKLPTQHVLDLCYQGIRVVNFIARKVGVQFPFHVESPAFSDPLGAKDKHGQNSRERGIAISPDQLHAANRKIFV